MNNTNTGGPAFPGLHPSAECRYQEEGMTLRDYFAAKAMQSYLTDRSWRNDIPHAETARVAYIVADYMLKAREA